MSKKIKIPIFLLILSVLLSGLVIDSASSIIEGAVTDRFLDGFGGAIRDIIYCTCNGNIGVVLDTGSGIKTYLFVPGFTILYPFGQMFSVGPNVVGVSIKSATCTYGTPPACSVLPINGGTMVYAGTSK